ncbi:MAG: polysaccharide deacetylase family protein [Terriglobales bacterium]
MLPLRQSLLGRSSRSRPVCVVGLHRVLNEGDRARSSSQPAIVLREANFAKLLEYLREEFEMLSLRAFLENPEEATRTSKPCCLLTFDDGWIDNYTTAFPLLSKFAVPATVFLATHLVGSSEVFWVERLSKAFADEAQGPEVRRKFGHLLNLPSPDLESVIESLKHMPAEDRVGLLNRVLPAPVGPENDMDRMLSWDQARIMSKAGIDFGAHSLNHPLLTYESADAVERQVQGSKRAIEENLRQTVSAFAYPNGDWNHQVREAVRQLGFACAFTTQPGWYRQGADRYTVPRVLLHDGRVVDGRGTFSTAALAFALTGWR